VPEINRTGQFAAWVKAHTELHLISLNKYGGLPFTPAEIRAKVMEFLGPGPEEPAVEIEAVGANGGSPKAEEVAHG
jgi:hypothetical protein